MIKFPVALEFEVEEKLFNEILEIAAGSAITYWAHGLESDLRRGEFRIEENEVSSGEFQQKFDVTIEAIKLGITRILAGKIVNMEISRAVYEAVATNDACNIDDWCADSIVQAAMFNELVYG